MVLLTYVALMVGVALAKPKALPKRNTAACKTIEALAAEPPVVDPAKLNPSEFKLFMETQDDSVPNITQVFVFPVVDGPRVVAIIGVDDKHCILGLTQMDFLKFDKLVHPGSGQ